MTTLPFRRGGAGVILHVRLTPKGGRDGIDGVTVGDDGKAVLAARVRAVPENGAANEALIALLAKALDVRRSAISLVGGGKSRIKALEIAGDAGAIEMRLLALCGTGG